MRNKNFRQYLGVILICQQFYSKLNETHFIGHITQIAFLVDVATTMGFKYSDFLIASGILDDDFIVRAIANTVPLCLTDLR